MTKELRQRIAKQIEEAFADTPYPGDENISPEAYEGERLTADFKGKHWRDIPLDHIFYHRGDLHFLTTAGFRFYLPAFLLAMLRHRTKVDTLPIGLLMSLAPPQEFMWRRMWGTKSTKLFKKDFARITKNFRERMRGFMPQERAAILSFLVAYEQLFPDDVIEPRLLRKAIEYWQTRVV